MSVIRILHMVSSLNIGGSQNFVMNLYRNIDRSRIQFDFIIDHDEHIYYKSEIEELGGKVYTFPCFKGTNIAEIKKYWKQFFLSHPEYKIFHCHSRSYASIYIPIARKLGIITILHSHSNSNGKGLSAVVKNILQLPLRYQAEYYMACSLDAGRWLFGNGICKSNKFFIINNAIDTVKFAFNEDMRKEIRNNIGIKDEFVLGYLARVTKAKNPIFVIDVMKELKKNNSKFKITFCWIWRFDR